MELLIDFWQETVAPQLTRLLELEELALVGDHSAFVFVDGEEGDYGVIRYSDAAGQLVAIKTVHGGDSESVELTPFGKSLLREKLIALLDQALED